MRKAAALAWNDSADGTAEAGEARSNSHVVNSNLEPTKGAAGKEKRPRVKYSRRTIELHPEIEKMLDKMQSDLRLRSHTEVMQKAIQLLAVVLGDDENGRRKIFIERKDGKLQELLII